MPHHSGSIVLDSEAAPYYTKITNRLNKLSILPEHEQHQFEMDNILKLTKENFRKCETTLGSSPDMIGAYKGCLGRNTGLAMSQIGFLESMRPNPKSRENRH